MQVTGQVQSPSGGFSDRAKTLIIIGIFVFIIVVISLLFMAINMFFEGLNDNWESMPYTKLSSSGYKETEIHGLTPPVDYRVIGSPAGTQYLVVLDERGDLMVYRSQEMFSENLTGVLLTHLDISEFANAEVRLGYLVNGSVIAGLNMMSTLTWWLEDSNTGKWSRVQGYLGPIFPAHPDIGADEMPEPENVREWDTSWDMIEIGGMTIAAGMYGYWPADTMSIISPSIVFRTGEGPWSTIVRLNGQVTYMVRIAGTSIDDLFIVTNGQVNRGSSDNWMVYSITDDSLLRAGEAPPIHGI